EPEVVPAYVAAQPGRALVLEGGIEHGLDITVVRGDGPALGDVSVASDAAHLEPIAHTVQDMMTDADPDAVEVLAEHGITAIYAPVVDPQVARRLDAMPALAPAGSDRSGSRVWSTELDVSQAEKQPEATRPVVAAGQSLAWLIAI